MSDRAPGNATTTDEPPTSTGRTPTFAGRTSRALRAGQPGRRATAAEQELGSGKAQPEEVTVDEIVVDEPAVDPAVDEAVTDKAVTDKAAVDQTTADADNEVTADEVTAENAAAENAAADEHVDAKQVTAKDDVSVGRRSRSRVTVAVAAFTAAAAVYAVVAGVLWWRSGDDGSTSAARTRDAVVLAASQDIVALNTADYRQAAAALRKWQSVSTGTLGKEFTDAGKEAVAALQKAKLVTSATVRDAAITELDSSKGTATVIASVYLKRQPITGAATTSRNRFRASLTRVGDTWRLSDLAPVSVQLG